MLLLLLLLLLSLLLHYQRRGVQVGGRSQPQPPVLAPADHVHLSGAAQGNGMRAAAAPLNKLDPLGHVHLLGPQLGGALFMRP